MEKIVFSAVKIDDKIYKGKRHCDCFKKARKKLGKYLHTCDDTQGFLTNQGRFVSRIEATKIAFKAGQITKRSGELFSEDLIN